LNSYEPKVFAGVGKKKDALCRERVGYGLDVAGSGERELKIFKGGASSVGELWRKKYLLCWKGGDVGGGKVPDVTNGKKEGEPGLGKGKKTFEGLPGSDSVQQGHQNNENLAFCPMAEKRKQASN